MARVLRRDGPAPWRPAALDDAEQDPGDRRFRRLDVDEDLRLAGRAGESVPAGKLAARL